MSNIFMGEIIMMLNYANRDELAGLVPFKCEQAWIGFTCTLPTEYTAK